MKQFIGYFIAAILVIIAVVSDIRMVQNFI